VIEPTSMWTHNARFHASSTALPSAVVVSSVAIPVAAMALLAGGTLGRIGLIGAPVDAGLVIASVLHAFLGCVLTAIQWGAGTGLALWFTREKTPRLTSLMLSGFPLSLGVMAAWSWLTLALPFGWIPALAGLIACFWSFLRSPPNRQQAAQLIRTMLLIAPMAIALGCWMGLLAHGPTEHLPGRPSGDVAYYAASIYSLESHPFPFVNLANEGETLLPLNLLYSTLGASLLRFFPLDPFQFVLASGATTFAFGLGLALFAWLSLRPRTSLGFPHLILALAAIVGTRYPYWIVESLPVIFALPLTVSIWYRVTNASTSFAPFTNLAVTVFASAMSKVTAVITLAPVAFAPVIENSAVFMAEIRKLPVLWRAIGLIVAAGTILYAGFMASRFGYYVLAQGGISPESYEQFQLATQNHLSRREIVLPYAMRDTGTVLLIVLAFRMLRWPFAAALATGLIAALAFPYAMRINLDCGLMIIALAGIDDPARLQKSKFLALIAYLLCLPAIIQTDFGGHPSSAVWLLCMGTTVFVVIAQSQIDGAAFPLLRLARLVAVAFTLSAAFVLVAVARQEIAFANAQSYLTIPSTAHDIWTAVRERTPATALVFTDQTGKSPGDSLDLNGKWNTYATTGQRQIYIAGWYQTPELRQSTALLKQRLAINESVLSGRTPPTQLQYRRGPYSGYFAVVNRERQMPLNWRKQYQNQAFALYRYAPAPPH
jgi:hypothetical protein